MGWDWPQWAVIVLMVLGCGIALGRHGQERDPVNFWSHAISVGITAWILWAGGFWN